MRDALVRIGRFADPPLEPIVPAASAVRLPEQARVLVHGGRGRRRSRLPSRRALGRGHRHRGVPPHDRRSATRSGSRSATGRARSGSSAYDQETGSGYLRHLVVREGRNTGQALVVLVTAPGERFEAGYFVDVLRRFPEVRSIHWAINDTPAEQTNLPTRLLWGEDAIEEEILGLRVPGAAVGLPADEHRDGRAPVRARARVRRAHGRRERLRPLLRHGHDRARPRRERALRVGARDLRGGGRLRDRERRAERDRERALLRGQRRARRSRSSARRRGARTSSSSTRLVRASRARRYAVRARSARRGSSTSPATRRRSPRTCRSSATSTATSSSAAARSTCSRTRRTSSPSPLLSRPR